MINLVSVGLTQTHSLIAQEGRNSGSELEGYYDITRAGAGAANAETTLHYHRSRDKHSEQLTLPNSLSSRINYKQ